MHCLAEDDSHPGNLHRLSTQYATHHTRFCKPNDVDRVDTHPKLTVNCAVGQMHSVTGSTHALSRFGADWSDW